MTESNLLLAVQFRTLSLCTAFLFTFKTCRKFGPVHWFFFILLSNWTLKFQYQLGISPLAWCTLWDSLLSYLRSSCHLNPTTLFDPFLHLPITPTAFYRQSQDINPIRFIWVRDKQCPCVMHVDFTVSTNINEYSISFAMTFRQPNILECQYFQDCLRHTWLQNYLKKIKRSSVGAQIHCCMPTVSFHSHQFTQTPDNKIFSVLQNAYSA